jgi:hypothetical protein
MRLSIIRLSPLVIALLASGCASTRDVQREERYRMSAVVESDPPGYAAYVGKKYIGQTPAKFSYDYTHRTEELTFGGYRTGMTLLISGAAGMAVAGGMIAGGVVLMDNNNDGGSALMGIGVLGAIYGFIGTIYGTIAMVGSSPPRVVDRTLPHKLTFGVKSPAGAYKELEVMPINDRKPKVHFDEISRIKYDERTGKWSVPGLKNLKVEERNKK